MRDQKLRRRSSFILPRSSFKKCPAADSSRCRPPPRIAERRDSSIVDRQIAQCQIEKYEARKSKSEIRAGPAFCSEFGFGTSTLCQAPCPARYNADGTEERRHV